MGNRMLLLLVAAAAVGLVVIVALSGGGPPAPADVPPPPAPPPGESVEPPPVVPDEPRTGKSATPGEPAASGPETAKIGARGAVEGTVFGPDGSALALPFSAFVSRSPGPNGTRFLFGGRVKTASFPAGDGRFRVEGISPGWYTASARAAGHVEAASKPFEVKGGETTTGIRIDLQAGGSIRGLVTDAATGRPVPGARVFAKRTHVIEIGGGELDFGPPGADRVKTDEQGRFLLDGLAPGTYRVRAKAKEFATGRSEEVDVVAGAETRGVLVPLGRGGTITGTVYGADGRPVAGETVLIQEVRPDLRIYGDVGTRATTDENGVYRLEHLDPGRYRVKRAASRSGRGSAVVMVTGAARNDTGEEPGEDVVTVSEGEIVTKDLRAEKRAGIRGVVVDEAGRPLIRRQVQLLRVEERKETTGGGPELRIPQIDSTDARGAFEFPGIDPGTWEVRSGSVSETVDVKPGETREVRLVVAPGRVEGIVVDTRGRPLGGVRVLLESQERREGTFALWPLLSQSPTGKDGRFVLEKVDPGRYRARAHGTGHTGRSEVFEVVANGTVRDVRIVAERLVRVRLTFLGPDGAPHPGRWVSLAPRGSGESRMGRTDRTGVATFHVPPGEYRVRSGDMAAFQGGRMTDHGTIPVREGDPVSRELRIE